MRVSGSIEVRQGEPNSAPTTIQYRYDPFGRRIAKSVKEGANTRTTYFINGENALMAEADEQGQMTKAYGFNPNTQGDDEDLWSTDPVWLAQTSQGSLTQAQFHYLETDHLGTPILAVNQQGAQSWRGYSEAFGNTGIDPNSTLEMNLRFAGQYYDKETNLNQNWFRDYSPATGRYIQSDLIGLDGGMNLYEYADGNPLYYYDPYGLWVPGDPLPQGLVDFTVGFGDGIFRGMTRGFGNLHAVRNWLDVDGGINYCSAVYKWGSTAGTVYAAAIPIGRVIPIGRREVTTTVTSWAPKGVTPDLLPGR